MVKNAALASRADEESAIHIAVAMNLAGVRRFNMGRRANVRLARTQMGKIFTLKWCTLVQK